MSKMSRRTLFKAAGAAWAACPVALILIRSAVPAQPALYSLSRAATQQHDVLVALRVAGGEGEGALVLAIERH